MKILQLLAGQASSKINLSRNFHIILVNMAVFGVGLPGEELGKATNLI